jgi:hypothetical protein
MQVNSPTTPAAARSVLTRRRPRAGHVARCWARRRPVLGGAGHGPRSSHQLAACPVAGDRQHGRGAGDGSTRVTEETWPDALDKTPGFAISESPTYVARGVAALAQDPEVAQFAGRVLTARQLADRYGVTDADGSRPDAWRYIVDVREKGLPADVTGYR